MSTREAQKFTVHQVGTYTVLKFEGGGQRGATRVEADLLSQNATLREALEQVKALRSIVQERRPTYRQIAEDANLGDDMRAQHYYSEMMLHSFDTWLGQIFGDVSPHGSVYAEVKRRAALASGGQE